MHTPRQDILDLLRNRLAISDKVGIPVYLAQQDAVEYIKDQTGEDLSHVLKLAPAQNKKLQQSVAAFVKLDERLKAIEAEQARQAEILSSVAKTANEAIERLIQEEMVSNHFTVAVYARVFLNESLPQTEVDKLIKKANKFCRKHYIMRGVCPDPQMGFVKTYPKWMLDKLFDREE